MAGKSSPGGGLLEALLQIFADIVTDARHKVVEHGWFGRQVTDTDPISPIRMGQHGERNTVNIHNTLNANQTLHVENTYNISPGSDREFAGQDIQKSFAERCDTRAQESRTPDPSSPDHGIDR